MSPLPTTPIIVVLICSMTLLGLANSIQNRACPAVCDCTPDVQVGPWAMRASCEQDDMKQIPQLTENITTVTIGGTALTILGDLAFEGAPYLREIVSRADNLVQINSNAFLGLNNLSTLNIVSKGTIHLEAGVFDNVASLTSLKLIGNLTTIPGDYLCGSSMISYLGFGRNRISKVAFNSCVEVAWQHLASLILEKNPLSAVGKEDFYHLRNGTLKVLSLADCKLVEIPPDLFHYLPRLTNVDIGKNKISTLPPGIFDNLRDLHSLQLEGTYISTLPQLINVPVLNQLSLGGCTHLNLSFGIAFRNATQLKVVDMNNMVISTIGDNFFSNLTHSIVEKITLQQSQVGNISVGAFKPLGALRSLNLNQNFLGSISLRNISKGIGLAQLQTLDADNAGLENLPSNTFDGFSANNSLSQLSLQTNNMVTIETNAFYNLHNLQELRLDHNNLNANGIKPGAFRGLDSLQQLTLDDNRFNDFPSRSQLGISAPLQMLSLQQNGLKHLELYQFPDWGNLTSLFLSQNSIETVGLGSFYYLENLTTLYLDGNRISHLQTHIFQGLVALEILSLQNNRIIQLNNGSFQDLLNLKELHLRENIKLTHGSKTWSSAFKGLTKLRILNLGSCGIPTLPSGIFSDNRNLEILDLSGNAITSWESKLFKPLGNLTVLILNNNKITSVHKTSFIYLTSLRRLDLAANPFACTCDLLWFKQWINNVELNLVNYGFKDRYQCASPPSVHKVPLIDFLLTEDDCSSHLAFHLTIGVCSGVVLVCTLCSLIYRYRWYFRYYIFLASSHRHRMQDAQRGEEDFRYDVYVCYHNTSRHWVIHSLLPELEYRGGIKLCLHDRDWLPGPAIMDNIIESIEYSRKTLLLVNNGFAQSVWCREETCLAYYQLVQDQRNLLVVVLLEDVQPQNMDKTLRAILSSRTYLAWNDGVKKEARFWKALRAALRRPEHPGIGVEMGRP